MDAFLVISLIVGVAWCLWHEGTDWPAAVIFTLSGAALMESSFGGVLSSILMVISDLAQSIVQAVS